MGYHPIILGVKPTFKGILRVQEDLYVVYVCAQRHMRDPNVHIEPPSGVSQSNQPEDLQRC